MELRSLQMANPVLRSSIPELPRTTSATTHIFGAQLRFLEIEQTHIRLPSSSRNTLALRLKSPREPMGLTQEIVGDEQKSTVLTQSASDLFTKMKDRFLSFKKDKYLANIEHFKDLANAQEPKFMVIACADSRVCPSAVLGFQPGEAFVIRNIANLVPSYENGPSEVNAALDFAVNTLCVENILVVGHSCCGGIRALMSMEDEMNSSSFLHNWVVIGKNARSNTKAIASKLSFDEQCRHCEKESLHHSLLNLLTYPWIKNKVVEGQLLIHGGYYDFVDCTFEKWSLGNRFAPRMAHHFNPPYLFLVFLVTLSATSSSMIQTEARRFLETTTLPELPIPEIPTVPNYELKVPEFPKPEQPQLPTVPEHELPAFPRPEGPTIRKPVVPFRPRPEFPTLQKPVPQLPGNP
nr:beta carbonic anhydrase 5, chloroplastic isoform X2 [Ipomoea batatas]